MGRNLKIRKYNESTPVDYGYPNDQTTDNGFSGSYPGIVGGTAQDNDQIRCQASILVQGLGTISASASSTTVTGTGTHFTTDALAVSGSIYVSDGNGGYTVLGSYASTTDDLTLELAANSAVTVTDQSWYYTVVTPNASIVKQKSTRKFLVAAEGFSIQNASIVKGQVYMIDNPGNTDWTALGAGINAVQYDIFTALVDGTGLTTNGTAFPIGVCLLSNVASPTDPNTMSVAINNNGNTVYASRIKDHFVTDYETPYTGSNPGVTFIATFYTASGTDIASGKDIVSVENWS